MTDEFKVAKAHAIELEQQNGQRNQIYKAMEDLYWMRWPEEEAIRKQMQNVKITRSPRARNAILGAKRLLIATDPIISVPYDINNAQARELSDRLERFGKAMLFGSGRIIGNPIHYDAILSALLYADVVIGINSTKEMLDRADPGNKAVQTRLKEINKRTPFLFEVYNPMSCYGERDIMGLTTFYRKVTTTVGSVLDSWGEDGTRALRSNKDKKEFARNDVVTLCDLYDLKNRYVWLEGHEDPIKSEVHGLPLIPVAYSVAEGSMLFSKPEEQREPFLYTAWKSGVIDRENLFLTTIYSMIFSMGANPMYVDYLIDPDNPHPVDYSIPGGTIHYRVGERREVMSKAIIDPAMMDGWNIANELEMQSTIYRQALGEPVSSSTPYSSYALMSQSGRLPLIATQRMTGNTIAEALEIAYRWMKEEKISGRAQYEKITAEVTPDQIPDIIDIKVQLEIELPQDRLQMANAANMLAQGEKPLLSQRWVRENILNVGQSEDMTREIWNENTGSVFMQKYLYEKMVELEQIKQMAMQPQQSMASGMPGSQAMPMPGPMGGAMPQGMGPAAMTPNFGTPEQPTMPPGPQPVAPAEPLPPLAPSRQPMNRK